MGLTDGAEMYASVLLTALLMDCAFGDPPGLPHPVRWIGHLITFLDKILYGKKNGLVRGAVLTLSVLAVTVGAVWGALALLEPFPAVRLLVECYLIYAAIAWRSLKDESGAVASALADGNLPRARDALSRIVGRDTQSLSEAGVVRAAVETVGENAIDGVFSPLFFVFMGFALGCPAAAVWGFKAVSTLDSMVGYRNERYIEFGRFSARLDDVLNFIPARIGALFMLLGAACNGYKADRTVIDGVLRDRKKHASPNSAHGESAMAWLLGIQLGGPTSYRGVVLEKPFMGRWTREPNASDIGRSHAIMDWGVSLFLLASLLIFVLIEKIFALGVI